MRLFPLAAVLTIALAAASPLAAQGQLQGPMQCTAPRDACAFFDQYLAAFNRRDFEAFRVTLADDITVMFDSPAASERRDGRAAVEEAFRLVFPVPGRPAAPLPPPLRPENLRVQDLGDVVIISFHMHASRTIARRSVVMQRTSTGWHVVHIHASSFDLVAP